MSGCDNEVLYAEGIDLTNPPGSISNQLATDGFIYFGSTTGRPKAALPTSPDSSVVFTPGDGTLGMAVSSTIRRVPWTLVTTGTQALAVNNGYVGNNGTNITYTLPNTSAFGSIIRITNFGVGLPIIAQNALQSIHFASSTTSIGLGGSLTASEQFSSIELVCVVASTEWTVLSSIGNWTIL